MVMRRDWSFAAVQEMMVEAIELWKRTPGDGRWPFANDGPWHLVRPEGEADVAEIVLNAEREGKPAVDIPKRLPLSRADVRRRDQISEWLRFAPERDRKLVALVLARLARGEKNVKWAKVRRQLIKAGEPSITARGLGMRYSRAITEIVKALNGAENRGGILSTPEMFDA
jgi:hypothetical protein